MSEFLLSINWPKVAMSPSYSFYVFALVMSLSYPFNAMAEVAEINSDEPMSRQSDSISKIAELKTTWTLTAGRTIGQELQAWGMKAGWKVIWTMPRDWTVPANTGFSGQFETAAADVINTLAANGALIRAQFYDGNKTMVVTGPGVTAQ